MKNHFLFLLIFGFGFGLNAQSLSGNYKYSDKGDTYLYQFKNDSNLYIIHGKDTTQATYSIDTTQMPMQIDLQFYDSEGKAGYRTPCIFEFIGNSKDKIRMRMSVNMMDRPKGFLPKGNHETILLIKDK